MRDLFPEDWRPNLRKLFLGLDSWVDFSLFRSARGARESYERFSTFMDRFHVAGWRRGLIEFLSESATLGTVGLVLMLALAIPAFRMTSDDDWLKKSELSVTFLDRYGNEVGQRGVRHNDSIPLAEFPDNLIKAVLATEDRRFYDHFGVDITGTFRALLTNARAGGVVQGGSTLTQQLAKNLFLSNERTLDRKIKEAFLALWLESRLTKNEILKLYLDRAYMGGGAFGVDAAAQYYFNKSARDVDLAEAAMLAGLFKAPTKFSPNVNLPAARARANVVLDNLVDTGFMTEGQVFGARRHPATPVDRRDDHAPNYYLDYAFDEIKKLVETFPKSMTERVFVVRTALDTNLQRAADAAVENSLRQYGDEYNAHQADAVLMDVDGSVRAMVGGRDYGASQFNRATDAMRQPGSSFKPYVYATALEKGLKPTSIVVDAPICLGNWCPHNYGGGYRGAMQLITALTHSINTVAVRTLGHDRRRQSQARPRPHHQDRARHGHHHAAARYAVAADRRRRRDHDRACRRLRHLPQSRHEGLAARHPRGAHRRRQGGLALRPRRTEAEARAAAARRRGHDQDDEQRRRERHRRAARGSTASSPPARPARRTLTATPGSWATPAISSAASGSATTTTTPTNRMTGGALPAMTWHQIMDLRAPGHRGETIARHPRARRSHADRGRGQIQARRHAAAAAAPAHQARRRDPGQSRAHDG